MCLQTPAEPQTLAVFKTQRFQIQARPAGLVIKRAEMIKPIAFLSLVCLMKRNATVDSCVRMILCTGVDRVQAAQQYPAAL